MPVDLDSEMLYNVKVSTNITSRFAMQAGVRQNLGLDNIITLIEAADHVLVVFVFNWLGKSISEE
jgi:hypothetical protein